MLSDFGTITTRDNDLTKRRNTMCGTILYLAPEVSPPLPFSVVATRRQRHGGRRHLVHRLHHLSSLHRLLPLRGRERVFFLPPPSRRLNVIDSIEHFCVDMLDFPDYIPADAIVGLLSASHAGPDQAHAAVRPAEANHHARDQGGRRGGAIARTTRSSKASTSPRCRRSGRRMCRRSCRCR